MYTGHTTAILRFATIATAAAAAAWTSIQPVFASADETVKSPEATLAKPLGDFDDLLRVHFDGLLDKLQGSRIDYAADSLETMLYKQQQADAALDEFSRQAEWLFCDDTMLVANRTAFRAAVSPRLTGKVHRVGAEREFKTIEPLRTVLQPGDLILLDPGEYALGDSNPRRHTPWTNVAILGAGEDKTTLTGQIESAERLRIEGVTFNCNDAPFIDTRDGGKVHLRKCRIFNYNSGAGGSNAINTSGAILLIEDCVFEGRSGRSADHGSFGDAFDMRGANLLYVRNTTFIDNDEVIRATFPCMFDRCVSRSSSDREYGILPYSSGWVVLVENKVAIRRRDNVVDLTMPLDDPRIVRHLAGEDVSLDPPTRELVASLGLDESVPYWLGIYVDGDPGIRHLAARKLQELTGEEIAVPAGQQKANASLGAFAPAIEAELEYARLLESVRP